MATTNAPTGRIRTLATIIAIAGAVMIVGGIATWFMVRGQLADEKITVSGDADMFAGSAVDGPLSAYAQASVINKHALAASDGLTYSELAQDDPRRDTVMTASFLRASLFTSVVSFGVAFMAAGLGVVFVLVAWALFAVARSLQPADSPAEPSAIP